MFWHNYCILIAMTSMKMEDKTGFRVMATRSIDRLSPRFSEMKTELVRKSIHFSIALVPVLASINLTVTMFLVSAGTLFYAIAETLRAVTLASVSTARINSGTALVPSSTSFSR